MINFNNIFSKEVNYIHALEPIVNMNDYGPRATPTNQEYQAEYRDQAEPIDE